MGTLLGLRRFLIQDMHFGGAHWLDRYILFNEHNCKIKTNALKCDAHICVDLDLRYTINPCYLCCTRSHYKYLWINS